MFTLCMPLKCKQMCKHNLLAHAGVEWRTSNYGCQIVSALISHVRPFRLLEESFIDFSASLYSFAQQMCHSFKLFAENTPIEGNELSNIGRFQLDTRNVRVRLSNAIFTARCTLVQSAILRLHVVCPSVRPSVRPSAIDMAQNRPHWTLSMFGAMHSV